jgi:hypothetical protein
VTIISDFLSKVQSIHATGNATEHSYRSAFEALFAALGVTALNEPKRQDRQPVGRMTGMADAGRC